MDWEIVNRHFVRLRAWRDGSGDRLYMIFVTAVDPSGNQSVKRVDVRVRPPKD